MVPPSGRHAGRAPPRRVTLGGARDVPGGLRELAGHLGAGAAIPRLQRPPGRASNLLSITGGAAGPDRRRTPRTPAAPPRRRERGRRSRPPVGGVRPLRR